MQWARPLEGIRLTSLVQETGYGGQILVRSSLLPLAELIDREISTDSLFLVMR